MILQQISVKIFETGIYQNAAIHLYKAMGFIETNPFGNYTQDSLSIFMKKKLPNP